ncbi:MAG: hypothetical protein HXY52_01565 [Nitrospirae bacterium]|jgi:general secretion pathway protein C|nr:hypothetical protein [Nitrospirota bacterium]
MHSFINKKPLNRINFILGIVLLVLILTFVRDIITYKFQNKKSLKNDTSNAAQQSFSQITTQFIEYAPLMKNNIFGIQTGELKQLTASSMPAVQQMNFTLIGTVSGPKELSYAIFRNNSGIQEIFKIGDSVFGAGKLHSVKKDKVLIQSSEGVKELPIEDIVKVREIKSTQSSQTLGVTGFTQRVGRSSYIVDQTKLQQIIANPSQIMTDARLKPNSSNGRTGGFILSEVKPGGIYQSLGLQDGDVLLKINEYEISNPEVALQALTALKGLDRVEIDLIRAGSRMTMNYQIK